MSREQAAVRGGEYSVGLTGRRSWLPGLFGKPVRHAATSTYITRRGKRVQLALCGVTVRERLPELFSRHDHRACRRCRRILSVANAGW